MSRYMSDIRTAKDAREVERTVSEYLGHEGFARTHEGVWQKGHGLLVAPQFVRVTPDEGRVHVEAWLKFALLPGVYVGEMGTKGILGAAMKRRMRTRISQLEHLLQEPGRLEEAPDAWMEQLTKLTDLHDAGTLSDEEYAHEKERVLAHR